MSNKINKKADEVKEIGANIKQTLMGEKEIDSQDVLKKAAIAGGIAILIFWLIAKMFDKSNEDSNGTKKKKKKKNDSVFFGLVKQQIGLIILAVIRKQINKLLQEYKLIDEKESV